MDSEKLYSYLVRRIKVINKELKELKERKINAISIPQEKEILLEIIKKEERIVQIKEILDFSEKIEQH